MQTYSREHYSSVVRDVLNFVDFHYMEPLNLESLAGRYSVNKNYLSTRFHKEVGMTVTDYINLTRVRRSLKLLSGTTLSMPEIAERCGFPHLPEDPRFYADRISELSAKNHKKSLNDGCEPPEGPGHDIVHGLQNALSKRQSPFVYRQVDSAFFFFSCRYKNRFSFRGTRGKWILPCFPFFSVTLSAPACSALHAIFSFLSPIFR